MTRKYKPVPGCPDELKPIMGGVNLLPDNAGEILGELKRLAGYVNESALLVTWAERDALQARVEKIVGNKKLSDLLIGISKNKKPILNINKVSARLASLEQSRRILRYIAKKNLQQREQTKSFGIDRLTDYFELAGMRGKPRFVVLFNYDEQKGLPSVHIPPLLALIQKGDIASFDRVAVCPICQRVYWSRKTNSGTCGNKKCAINLANRKRLAKAKAVRETKLIKGVKNNGTL